jgi:excinuclease ABC subunit C
MKEQAGKILYVGKAKNLKSRVRSYFGKSSDSRYQIKFLMGKVTEIDYIVTDTEKEALILENTLIKKYRPRYNINLRDDKTYFSLRMDLSEEFPRLTVVRKVPKDGARYFGPYSSASSAREMLKQLYKLFRLCHYPVETCRRRKRPCLFHQIDQCSAPCFGHISRDDYHTLAEGAALFLEGKNRELVKVLRKKMHDAAASENFEEAARLRETIRSIDVTVEKQKVFGHGGDIDVIGFFRDGDLLEITVLFIRNGNLTGNRNYSLTWEMDDGEGVSSFLNEYYNSDVFIPQQVLLPTKIEEPGGLEELLSEKKGEKISLAVPARGTKLELVKLADRNAETSATEKRDAKESAERVLRELQEKLHLAVPPRRIECFDISNIQGMFAVASKVSFFNGKPDREQYRRYRIRTVNGADDYGMMYEALSRRFRKSASEDDLPDLILVDGGPGQLNVLNRVQQELGMENIASASLAKSRVFEGMEKREVDRSDERVFLPGRKNPVVMRQNSQPLLMLARIRDEAHRFAVTYHKKLRAKETVRSALQSIAGVGRTRQRELLRHFGSLKKVREATLEELCSVDGIDRKTAVAIVQHFEQK